MSARRPQTRHAPLPVIQAVPTAAIQPTVRPKFCQLLSQVSNHVATVASQVCALSLLILIALEAIKNANWGYDDFINMHATGRSSLLRPHEIFILYNYVTNVPKSPTAHLFLIKNLGSKGTKNFNLALKIRI